eukprot:725552-Amorphochlora_amoeboformis.AAC.1
MYPNPNPKLCKPKPNPIPFATGVHGSKPLRHCVPGRYQARSGRPQSSLEGLRSPLDLTIDF